MPLFYLVAILVSLAIFIVFTGYLLSGRTSVWNQLFIKCIQAENNGHFEAAVTSYEKASSELKNNWFHCRLELQIKDKLKMLHDLTTMKEIRILFVEKGKSGKNVGFNQIRVNCLVPLNDFNHTPFLSNQ
jgi:hypothetical protein